MDFSPLSPEILMYVKNQFLHNVKDLKKVYPKRCLKYNKSWYSCDSGNFDFLMIR